MADSVDDGLAVGFDATLLAATESFARYGSIP
jgi:hypothetical protein